MPQTTFAFETTFAFDAEMLRSRLLIVEGPETALLYDTTLRASFDVTWTSSATEALSALERVAPRFVITELQLPTDNGIDGVEVCRRAKALAEPAAVLVTTSALEKVPAALAAGCESVLLKPFAPNLLFSRLGRLRTESAVLRQKATAQLSKANHLRERSGLLLSGSNKTWPNSHCPRCSHDGVVSFDYASHRRMWYACLGCEKVWIAARQEDKRPRA